MLQAKADMAHCGAAHAHAIHPELQVPLLVSLGESERALDKAALSGDTDLVYYVLFR